MNFWRIFVSTFGLILIAELGDKTQLTVLAASAGTRFPLAIFLGASAALVASVGIAVGVGFYLQKSLPLQLMQFIAGVLFLIFGAISIYLSFHPSAQILANTAQRELPNLEPGSMGFLSRITLEAALEFEDVAANDYAQLASRAKHPRARSLFEWLAQEDGKHRTYIEGLKNSSGVSLPAGRELKVFVEVTRPHPADCTLENQEHDLVLLRQSVKHEESSMAFYEGLARSLKRKTKVSLLFEKLALEEQLHLKKIQSLLNDFQYKRV